MKIHEYQAKALLAKYGVKIPRSKVATTPEEAVARLGAGRDPSPSQSSEWPRVVVGATEQVHATLSRMAEELRVDEIMVVTVVHDHAARVRSYELLAEAFSAHESHE